MSTTRRRRGCWPTRPTSPGAASPWNFVPPIDVLAKRGARANRVATLGPLSADQHAALSARFGTLKNLNRFYVRLRQVKSAEELDWLRIGAHFSDLGMAALRDAIRPGINERELGAEIERAYVSQGATNVIHYIGTTSMAAPDLAVPRQFHDAPGAAGRRRGGRDQRGVSGSIRARCPAQLRAGRADQALPRAACGGRRRLPTPSPPC